MLKIIVSGLEFDTKRILVKGKCSELTWKFSLIKCLRLFKHCLAVNSIMNLDLSTETLVCCFFQSRAGKNVKGMFLHSS